MNRLLLRTAAATLFVLFLHTISTRAQIPRIISYQGVASESDGTPYAGQHFLRIALYASQTDDSPLFEQTRQVDFRQGLFSTTIGPLPESLTFESGYWLGIAIDENEEILPRTQLTTSPYAFRAGTAESADRSDSANVAALAHALSADVKRVPAVNGISNEVIVRGAGGTTVTRSGDTLTIRSEAQSGGTTTAWRITGNTGTNPSTNFIGTLDRNSLEIRVDDNGRTVSASSGRGRVMRYEPTDVSPNVIGGYHGNSLAAATVGATIAGGGAFDFPNVSGSFGVVGGGKGNTAEGLSSTVGGGIENAAQGEASTIGGGEENVVERLWGTVGGGTGNRARGESSTVGGGVENKADSYIATVGGGQANTAFGDGATVGGGKDNRVFGRQGTIAGGEGNATSSEHATVAGGRGNLASGDKSFVGGGLNDTASGTYSAVGGGTSNVATALTSTIAGGSGNRVGAPGGSVLGGSNNVVTGDYGAVLGGHGLTLSGDGSIGYLGGAIGATRTMSVDRAHTALLGNVDLWLASNDGTTRQIRLFEGHTSTGSFPATDANYTSFETGAQSTNIEYILPTTKGNVGDKLTVQAVSGFRVTLGWGDIISARSRKENFRSIDGERILTSFRDVDLGSWNYTGEDVRHYGIMADDFVQAFGDDGVGRVGADSALTSVDLAGVAYLAIQALERRTAKLEETERLLDETARQLRDLREELDALRKKVEKIEEAE